VAKTATPAIKIASTEPRSAVVDDISVDAEADVAFDILLLSSIVFFEVDVAFGVADFRRANVVSGLGLYENEKFSGSGNGDQLKDVEEEKLIDAMVDTDEETLTDTVSLLL